MVLLTAREAAQRLGKDERTIRRWIEKGMLTPRQSTSNRLAIDEQDIRRLAENMAGPDRERHQAITELEARVKQLEQDQAAILARLALLEDRAKSEPVRTPASIGIPAPRPHTSASTRPRQVDLSTPADVPPGSRQATEFAVTHGVNRATFRDHMVVGVRGDFVEHIALPKPNKPRETDRWLSPEQQRAVIAFWSRHDTAWQRCHDPACLICGDSQSELPGFTLTGEA